MRTCERTRCQLSQFKPISGGTLRLTVLCLRPLGSQLSSPPSGLRHGLRCRTERTAVMWNFAPEVFERPAPSSDFERECTKIFFSMAVTDDDPEAAALSAGVTPRRPAAFKPRSVLELARSMLGLLRQAECVARVQAGGGRPRRAAHHFELSFDRDAGEVNAKVASVLHKLDGGGEGSLCRMAAGMSSRRVDAQAAELGDTRSHRIVVAGSEEAVDDGAWNLLTCKHTRGT